MTKQVKLKKGFNIKLKGKTELTIVSLEQPQTIAIKPSEFKHQNLKLLVQPGDEVLAGTPIMFDKNLPDVKICSPVSGEVAEVIRGEKRVIQKIVVLADKTNRYVDFGAENLALLNSDQVKEKILNSGLWPSIIQRPFSIVANPSDKPKAIFISSFDTAPLAPEYAFILEKELQAFQVGIDALNRMAEGKVFLGVDKSTSSLFKDVKNAQINHFDGPHPAGNVGIQIHHISPINKGEVVWTVGTQQVIMIGRLFQTGKLDASKIVSTSGESFEKRQYYKTIACASVEQLTVNNLKSTESARLILGNVLTGVKAEGIKDYLGFYTEQLTAIPEGDKMEFLGWLLPSYPRPDINKSFPWAWSANKEFSVNTNFHGEERAFVVTGQYEKVLPMDIYPVQLLKSILYKDIDEMEALGIYEVAEEDFALCEFVCTSKVPVQSIIRDGIDLILEDSK